MQITCNRTGDANGWKTPASILVLVRIGITESNSIFGADKVTRADYQLILADPPSTVLDWIGTHTKPGATFSIRGWAPEFEMPEFDEDGEETGRTERARPVVSIPRFGDMEWEWHPGGAVTMHGTTEPTDDGEDLWSIAMDDAVLPR